MTILNNLNKSIKKAWTLYIQAQRWRKLHQETPKELLSLIDQLNGYPDFRSDQKSTEILRVLELVRSSPINTIVEIGSFRGGTLALLCQVAPVDALIISVDIKYPLERRLANSCLALPHQKLISIEGDSQSQKTLMKVKKNLRGKKIDLLFIDGDHSFFGVLSDYVFYSPLVRKGGVIAFHDIQPDYQMRFGVKTSSYVGEVPIFWDALKHSGLITEQIIEDPEQDGWGIGLVFKNE